MKKWNLIQNQLLNFNKFLKSHQSFPYQKGKSLKDMLVRAKKKKVNRGFHAHIDVRPVHPLYFLAQQVFEYFSNNSSWLCFI